MVGPLNEEDVFSKEQSFSLKELAEELLKMPSVG